MSTIVLLSGGMDSTAALFWAQARRPARPTYAVAIDYGQRHRAELRAAEKIARMAGTALTVLTIPLATMTGRPLLGAGDVTDAASSVIPHRNAVLVSTAAAWAGEPLREIVVGFCRDDAETYADCRADFCRGMSAALGVAVQAPWLVMSKAQIVAQAKRLGSFCWAALGVSVSCYQGGRCGACPACEKRAAGFAAAGFADPALESSQ